MKTNVSWINLVENKEAFSALKRPLLRSKLFNPPEGRRLMAAGPLVGHGALLGLQPLDGRALIAKKGGDERLIVL